MPRKSFQQLSFEHLSFTEKNLHKELAKNFEIEKNNLEEGLAFKEFVKESFYKKQLVDSNFTQTKQELAKNSFYQLAHQKQGRTSSFLTAAWFSRV